MILRRLFYILVCVSLIGCSINSSIADNKNKRVYKINEIPDNAIERIEDRFVYIIRFSNLIYNTTKTEKKKIKIPIFQGTLDDVEYDDFLNYCYDNKLLDKKYCEGGFFILTKKGEIKKTLLEFIKFYEGNILKGYEKPSGMVEDGDEPQYSDWIIEYEFKVENIPCMMRIIVPAGKRDYSKSIKSVEDINVNENSELSGFIYQLCVDCKL